MDVVNHLNHVLIIGPGPVQVGGVATFVQFLKGSSYLKERFTITHMDTARKVEDLATTNRFSFLNIRYFICQVFQLINLLLNIRPQIVHLSVTAGWSFWKILTFLLISRALKAKTVAHIHGGAFNIFFEHSHPVAKRIIAWGLNKADVVVALSNWWKEFYLQQISSALNVVVISNCPEETFKYSGSEILEERRNGNTILFVGSIGTRKGVFDILQAVPKVVSDFPLAKFVFLGKEEFEGEQEKINAICRNMHIEEYVNFKGHVTGEEKYRYYSDASIFILPSYAENLPFSVLEAMAMGLPVITTPVGGIPEIFEDNENGFLVNSGDSNELANKILLLLNDPQSRRNIGITNFRKMEAEFQPEAIARDWENLYNQLSV